MIRLFLMLPIVLSLCFIVGCQNKEVMAELESMQAQAKIEENNKALVRRNAGLMKDNLAAIEELHANYVLHLPGDQDIRGPEVMKQLITGFLDAFPDFHITIEDIFAEGDKVVYRTTRTATHKGEWLGVPATGRQVTWTYITIYRIEEGRIVEEWGQGDYVSLLDQVGVIRSPW